MLILPNIECLLNYVVKLQVLQGSDSFRAMFTVWHGMVGFA